MKAIGIILLVTISLVVSAQKQPTGSIEDPRLQSLDTAFQRTLTAFRAAGFAVAVVEKNRVVYARGFGFRNVEEKLPVTPNTIFPIGSCTKAFTASLIGLLQKEGKINIDKPVNSFIPALRFYHDDMNNTITLRDMMSHRTGLPRHDISWIFFPTASRDSILQRVQYQEPTAPVRSAFQYNNFMFAAQGAIIEKLTAKSWEENMSDKFFVPLGMTASNTSIERLVKSNEPALGYEVYDNIIHRMEYEELGGMGAAGAVNSTVNDMARWVIAWINGGRFQGREIIPADYCLQAISSQMVVNGSLPGGREPGLYFNNYGLGWFLSSYKGHYRVEHGGNVNGFSASTCFFPADSIGIIVLSNQDGSAVPDVVSSLVADRLFGQKYDDWTGYWKEKEIEDKAEKQKLIQALNELHNQQPATHALTDFAGTYFNPGYGRIRIFLLHDSLFAQGSLSFGWLRHYTYDSFDFFTHDRLKGIDTTTLPFRIQFLMNAKGDIEGISGIYEAGLKPIVFTKEPEAVFIATKDLPKYAGDYTLNGALIKVYTKETGGLYVLSPGLPEYELIYLGKDKFGAKSVTGYVIQFDLDAAGKVTGATFKKPAGNFKAVKR